MDDRAAKATSSTEPTRVDPPTLFELPNLDPLAPFAPQSPIDTQTPIDDVQHVLHNSHQGPPAGHVDPPSGNQIGRDQRPSSPAPSGAIDSAAALQREAMTDPTERDFKSSEYSSWGGRSALIILMLIMVTLAFVAGQTLTQLRDRDATSESKLADDAAETAADSHLAQSENATRVSDAGYDSQYETEVVAPGYVAGPLETKIAAQSRVGSTPANHPLTLGEPTIAVADSTSADLLPEPIPNSSSAVVGFRSSGDPPPEPSVASSRSMSGAPTTSSATSTAPLDDLPSGMGDRLKLEDGYVQSETPFSIESFLSEEGLRMIAELDDPEPTSNMIDDLDPAFFEIPLEF
ncbi:MAG: hypothetical protein AAFU85_00415 [Planctomycetota bacterium]